MKKKIYIRELEKTGIDYYSGLGVSNSLYRHKLWLEGNKKGKQAELKDINISKADLSFFNLSKAKIFAHFEDIQFSHTIFDNASFSHATFFRCTFDSASFKNAILKNVEFIDCDFINTSFKGATINNTKISIRRDLNIDFDKTKFIESNLVNYYNNNVVHTDLKTFLDSLFFFTYNKSFFQRTFIFDLGLSNKKEQK